MNGTTLLEQLVEAGVVTSEKAADFVAALALFGDAEDNAAAA